MSSSGAKILFNPQRSFKPPAAKLQATRSEASSKKQDFLAVIIIWQIINVDITIEDIAIGDCDLMIV